MLPTARLSHSANPLTPIGFELLCQAAHHAPELTLLLNAQHHIQYANPAVQNALGSLPTGWAAYSLIHLEDRAALALQVRHLQAGQTAELPTFRVQHTSGRWVWLTGRVTHFLENPHVQALLIHLRPASRSQDLHRAALARISRALSATYDVSEVVDAALNEGLSAMEAAAGGIYLLRPDGQVLDLIGHAGYTDAAISGWEQFPVTLRTPVTDAIRERRPIFLRDSEFRAQYAHMYEVHARTFQSAAALPLMVGANVIGAISLAFHDDRHFEPGEQEFLLTVADQCAPALDRSRLYHDLQREQDWYRTVTRNASDIVTVLSEQGVIAYESGAVERVLGYSPTELLGRNAFELVHPDDHAPVQHALARLAPDGGPITATYRIQHRDGHWVWMESLGVDLRHHPHVRGLLINSRDITARTLAQLEQAQTRQALEVSERNFRRLADNSSDLVRQYAVDGKVEYCSPSAWDLLGYQPDELLNSDPLHVVHAEDQPALRDAFLRRFTPEFEREKFEYRLRHRNGSDVWVETSFKALRDPVTNEITGFIGTTHEINQRKFADLKLRAQLERYQHLLNFTVSLEQLHSPVDLATEALRQCLNLTEYDYGYAFEYSERTVRFLAKAGDPPLPGASEEALYDLPFAASIRRALRRNEAYFLEETRAVFDPPEPLPRKRWVSLCVLPITRQGELVAILAFGTDQGITTSPGTRQLLSNVSARLSHALERQHHLAQLNTSREETLRALGLALEYRDYETKGHTDRVVTLTEQLGQALGFTGHDLDALRWGAFLHDTGKVAIPDAILLKPGQLDPHEWAVIKRHPSIGYEMLHHIPSLPPGTLEVVLYHQERWNGSGYPRGLAGTDIPLAARVFAVVDVYDALTSERPYKTAWTHQDAAAQLRREAGVLLDARVVDAFLQLPVFGEAQQAHNHDRHSP
ncbi:PAS domain S-box protein (plasmid) [Deinococcus taeanensis]|uniref:PAS domain S-box protein n=1 Tax=Deinococcus taeanensis TaxID=2737050 RepID=UPI001CDD2AE9|nr:PAS domain S-box protein [Deinococcus taeanensis]UBV45412.1 PAS domain S-box protein [Deinococcus taeanensis]